MSGLQRHNDTQDSENWIDDALHQADFQLDQLLQLVEQKAINLALREYAGNVSKAAAMLGINRTTLYGRMDRLEDRN